MVLLILLNEPCLHWRMMFSQVFHIILSYCNRLMHSTHLETSPTDSVGLFSDKFIVTVARASKSWASCLKEKYKQKAGWLCTQYWELQTCQYVLNYHNLLL